MSLYNALFGVNKLAPLLLKMLALTDADVGRFRDAYLNGDGSVIIVYTRNGGGNREEYQGVLDALSSHPNYLRDYDDDFDCTYAYIECSVPEQYKALTVALATGAEPATISARFGSLIEAMQSGQDTAETKRAEDVGKRIFGAMESGQGIIEV